MTSATRDTGRLGPIVLGAWIFLCIALYVLQAYDRLPSWLNALLAAGYQE